MGPFWGFRGCGIWSKDRPAREGNPRSWLKGRAARAPFFVPKIQSARPDAQKNRHLHHPDHRRRSHRDRPGLRIRLFRHAGGEGAEGRGLPGRPGQFQSGHDHDRPGTGRCHLYRADHAGNRRQDHREGAPRHSRRLCAAADHGRPDRAELRAVAAPPGHARQIRRRDDRRHRGRHRQGGRPPAVPRGHDQDRAGDAEVAARQCVGAEEILSRQIPGRTGESSPARHWKNSNGSGRSARTIAASAIRSTRSARR